MRMQELRLRRIRDDAYALESVSGLLYAYVCYADDARGAGWWVNPMTTARRPQRTRRATPAKAASDYYRHSKILNADDGGLGK